MTVKAAPPAPVDIREIHHGSHNHLLSKQSLDGVPSARLDAIIVPTAWPVDALRHVMEVGKAIDCPVIALCSRAATAEQATKLANHLDAAVLAVDVDDSLAAVLPDFSTDRLLRAEGFASTSDLSLKRNLGLTLARGSNWKRVLFLDDDILVEDPEQLPRAARLLDDYHVVGLANRGFADNSVVCHAYRAVGGDQNSFIGGGAMMIDATSTWSYFPNIYNEDWFFLVGDGVPFRAARAGVMKQRAYDPFANPGRAEAEEFGDTLAEGLFWLLDFGRPIDTAGNGFWGDALYRRRQLIDHILTRASAKRAPERIRLALEAARGRSADVSDKLCREAVQAWQADLGTWGDFLRRVPVSSSPDKFLSKVGMHHQVHQSRNYGRVAEPAAV